MKLGKTSKCLVLAMVCLMALPLSAGAAEKVFKVGAAQAFSGPLAFVGNGFRNGGQIAADYFNEKGGLNVGGEKYIIKIVDADTKYTSDGGTTAARRLVHAEKVNMVLGEIATPGTLGVLSVTQPAKILTLHTAAAPETLSKEQGRRYAFRSYISYHELFPGIFNFLVKKRKIKRLAMLDNDDESAHYGHGLVRKLARRQGFEIVYDDYFPPGTKDMGPFLLKAMGKKPDVFFNCASSGTYWGLIMKQARDLGYEGLFAESHPPTPIQTGEIAGIENMQGMIGFGYASEGDLAPEGIKRFKANYMEKHGDWHEHSLVPGLPLSAVFMAIEEAGTLDSDKIVDVLESGKEWKTPFGVTGAFGGTVTYGHPHQWFAPQFVIEVQGDKAVPIDVVPMEAMLRGWD